MQRWIFGFGAIWAEISDWGEKQESMRRTQREGIKEAVRSTSDIESRVLCLAERKTITEQKRKHEIPCILSSSSSTSLKIQAIWGDLTPCEDAG